MAAHETTFAPPADLLLPDATTSPFANDRGGPLAKEQLTPGPGTPLLVPYVTEPRPWLGLKLLDRANRSELPPALGAQEKPRLLPQERTAGLRHRPALDVPPLAGGAESPVRPELPAGARAFARGPHPAEPPVAELLATPANATLNQDDPTQEFSRRLARSVIELLRAQPAPFQRLSVPDPFENLRVAGMRTPPVESEAPVTSTARPPLPPLPVK